MKKHYYTDDILETCNGYHLTVDEIFEQIQKKFPESGKSSIYRNVEQLAEKGELKKVIGVGKKILFEKNKENHAHFICKNSGKIIDIPLNALHNISHIKESLSPEISGKFSVDSVDIKIYGTLQK